MWMPEIEVALFEPEIPQNTGNIGRLCVGFDTKLSLIGRLGFSLDDKHFRRAGLDYWQHLQWNFTKILKPLQWIKRSWHSFY